MKNKVLIYKPKDIIKANRLIGEFMGLKFEDDNWFKKSSKIDANKFHISRLGYSSLWAQDFLKLLTIKQPSNEPRIKSAQTRKRA